MLSKTKKSRNSRNSRNGLKAFESLESRELMTASPNQVVEFDISTTAEAVSNDIESFLAQTVAISNDGYAGAAPNLSVPGGADGSGSVVLESVHGTDDRTLVYDTTRHPWSSIVRLDIDFGSRSTYCSGAVISNFHVLTAGHCIHSASDGWADTVGVAAAQNGDQQFYGVANMTHMRSYASWTNDQNHEHDWAVITLDRNLGDLTGWMGREVLAESQYDNGIGLNTAGYPGDMGGRHMYHAFGETNYGTDHKIYYDGTLDTFGGQSGSPLWRNGSDGRFISGVHAYGGSMNSGTRLDTEKLNHINEWIAEDTGIRAPTDRADLVDYDSWFGTDYSVAPSGSAQAGDFAYFRTVVRNNGTLDSSSYNVEFVATSLSNGNEFELGNVHVSGTDRMDWTDVELRTVLPDLPADDYGISWIIDSNDSVSEFVEFNNRGYADDVLRIAANPQSILVPSSTIGEIDVKFGSDTFEFDATAGTTYVFETQLGTLSDSFLTLSDNEGLQILTDDDGGTGFASRLEWTADSSGVFNLEVRGYRDANGTYTLNAEVLEERIVGDVNNDGNVDSSDLGLLLNSYNGSTEVDADLNDDGVVNSADLGLLLNNFGYTTESQAEATDGAFADVETYNDVQSPFDANRDDTEANDDWNSSVDNVFAENELATNFSSVRIA